MKTACMMVAAITAAMAAPNASAEQWYVRAEAGPSFGQMDLSLEPFGGAPGSTLAADLDTGLQGLLGVGRELGGGFRLEAQLLYQTSATSSPAPENVDASLLAGLVQASYVFDRPGLRPMIGAGIGYGRARLDASEAGLFGDDIVWRVGGGAEWSLSDGMTISGGYWYTTGDFGIYEPQIHSLTVGLKVPLAPG